MNADPVCSSRPTTTRRQPIDVEFAERSRYAAESNSEQRVIERDGTGTRGSSGRVEEAGQELGHDLRLLLMRPMTRAIHHMNAHELGEAALPGLLGPTDPSIGAPILFPRDDLRGYIDRAPREGHHLQSRAREEAAPVIV